jgi:hypothetical protein
MGLKRPDWLPNRFRDGCQTQVNVFYPKLAGAGAQPPRRTAGDRLSQFVRVNRLTLLRVLGLRSHAGLPHAP